jgi:hypothetical protein
MQCLEVRKGALADHRIIEASDPVPKDGEAVLVIDRFALTANNVTYAVFGDMMQYWNFFPASLPDWGVVPVWGFATVGASKASGVEAGQRVFGYFPMASHLVVTPGRVSQQGFLDTAPHRQPMSVFYNQYMTAKPADGDEEGRRAVLQPLLTTGWLIGESLADQDFAGAGQVLVASASSKTAIAAAFSLKQRGCPRVVGLTSPRNRAFVAGLGLYDAIATYDQLASLDTSTPAALVDMAGDVAVVGGVHRLFGDRLTHSMIVGATHWDAAGPTEGLPGPDRTMFFAPSVIDAKITAWGGPGYMARQTEAMAAFDAHSRHWMRITEARGSGPVAALWSATLAGGANPAEGAIAGF